MFIYLESVTEGEDEHYGRGHSRNGVPAGDDTASTGRSSETSVTLFT